MPDTDLIKEVWCQVNAWRSVAGLGPADESEAAGWEIKAFLELVADVCRSSADESHQTAMPTFFAIDVAPGDIDHLLFSEEEVMKRYAAEVETNMDFAMEDFNAVSDASMALAIRRSHADGSGVGMGLPGPPPAQTDSDWPMGPLIVPREGDWPMGPLTVPRESHWPIRPEASGMSPGAEASQTSSPATRATIPPVPEMQYGSHAQQAVEDDSDLHSEQWANEEHQHSANRKQEAALIEEAQSRAEGSDNAGAVRELPGKKRSKKATAKEVHRNLVIEDHPTLVSGWLDRAQDSVLTTLQLEGDDRCENCRKKSLATKNNCRVGPTGGACLACKRTKQACTVSNSYRGVHNQISECVDVLSATVTDRMKHRGRQEDGHASRGL